MPPNNSARDTFTTLLMQHVRNGTRPNKARGEPWTYAELAAEVTYSGEESSVAETSVSNWCNGRALPRQIEPLLRALFGPETSERHAEARDQLREAFIEARAQRLRTPAKLTAPTSD
jgi:hypothetical protein